MWARMEHHSSGCVNSKVLIISVVWRRCNVAKNRCRWQRRITIDRSMDHLSNTTPPL